MARIVMFVLHQQGLSYSLDIMTEGVLRVNVRFNVVIDLIEVFKASLIRMHARDLYTVLAVGSTKRPPWWLMGACAIEQCFLGTPKP